MIAAGFGFGRSVRRFGAASALARMAVAVTLLGFSAAAAPASAMTIDSDILLQLDLGPRTNARTRGPSADAPKKEPEIPIIRATGHVQSGDHLKLRAILSKLKSVAPKAPDKPLAIIELHSPGGDILEGFKLGYLFREFDVATVVRKGKLCVSACAIAFLGGTISHLPPTVVPGRNIEIGGIVGFHNFYISPEFQAANKTSSEAMSTIFMATQTTAAGLARYMATMGIDPLYAAILMERPPTVWDWVDTTARFIDFNVCPLGIPPRPASADVLASNICSSAFGGSKTAPGNPARPVTAEELKRRLLAYIGANPRVFRLRKSEVERLSAAVAPGGDPRAVDALYEEMRDSGVPLPKVLAQSFQVRGSGGDIGEYPLQCSISLSAAEPSIYELVIEGPGGLSPALKPVSCPSLFAFSRDEEINPAPRTLPRWDGPPASAPPARR